MRRIVILLILTIIAIGLLAEDASAVKDPTLLMPVAWQQCSAEYRALCYQAYNIATFRLEQLLTESHEKIPAVVVDIDETVLDNSRYNAEDALRGTTYPDDFVRWNEAAIATAVPGAIEFLKFADTGGCAIFYISDRNDSYEEATMKNLRDLGFPQVDSVHVMLRAGRVNKMQRREIVAEKHDILLLVGDNLNDFDRVFREASDTPERKALADDYRNEFGTRFIVLPNAMSGSWLKLVLNFKRNLSAEEKARLLGESIEGFLEP